MRFVTRTFVRRALLSGALLAALGVSPAAAAAQPEGIRPTAVRQPDARIRYWAYKSAFSNIVDPRPWKGNNIYNSTGLSQTQKESLAGVYDDARFIHKVLIQNDGATSDRFKLKATATGAQGGGWTFRYFRGTTNITSAVVAGTYRTPTLSAGEKFVIRVVSSVGASGKYVRLITATSVNDTSRVDAVKLVFDYVACGC
jgi:hypothetical protein